MSSCPTEIALDEFAFRQFDDPGYSGTKLRDMSKHDFMNKVIDYYEQRRGLEQEFNDRPALVDGYAPFCKHLFMPNFVADLREPVLPINDTNEHLLRTKYEARTATEIPVLVRYFPADKLVAPAAKYLDLILYSRDQIIKENAATGKPQGELEPAPWRLISIKAQGVPYETPMNPITIMRNALISEGGSGIPINREAYMSSVDYWSGHAIIS
jgi:hypothetical protein